MSQQNEAALRPVRGHAPDRVLAAAPERTAFVGAVLVLVVALWSIPRLSFPDGAVHVAMAHLLTVLADGTADPILSRYFALNIQPEPNWFIYPILAGLLKLVGPHSAEKILLTGFAIGLPYAFRYAVTAVRPDNGPLAWYALPFVFAWPMNLGLYNFVCSLPWLFVTLGYALRHWTAMTVARTLVLALLALVTFFAHITSAIVLMLTLGALGVWLLWGEWRVPGASGLRPAAGGAGRLRGTVAAFAAALLPVAALTLLFAARHTGQQVEFGPDLWYRTKMLLYGNPILSHSRWEGIFATPVALLPFAASAILLVRRFRQGDGFRPLDGLLLAAVGVTLFSYVIPNNTSGGGLAVQRIQIYPYLLFMLWLAVAADWTGLRRATMTVSAVATAGLLAINLYYLHLSSRYVAEFEGAVAFLEPGRTFTLLDFTGWNVSPDGAHESFRLNFYGHAQSRFVVDRPLVDLNLYQASTPNFPVKYREEADPYLHIRGTGPNPIAPPPDEFLAVGKRSAIQVDYVLVWGLTPERAALPGSAPLLDQLAEGYEPVQVSEHGWMRIYRRKG